MIPGYTATGSMYSDANPIEPQGIEFSVDVQFSTAGAGVILPPYSSPCILCVVRNSSPNDILLYPLLGGTINGSMSPITITVGNLIMAITFSPVDWVTMPFGGGPPFAAPAFTAFNITGIVGPYEVGATISSGTYTFNWVTSNSGNIEANSISILDISSSITLATGLANDGSEAIAISSITNDAPATHTWQVRGTDIESNTFSRNYSVVWEWRMFAGTASPTILNASQIQALTDFNGLVAGFAGTYNFVDVDGYKYWAIPLALGNPSFFTDANTGLPIAMVTTADDAAYNQTANGINFARINVTNTNGVATDYALYRSENSFSGNFSSRLS